jgi:hypothetical protein
VACRPISTGSPGSRARASRSGNSDRPRRRMQHGRGHRR